MMDKQDYKKIIEETLTRKGFLSKPSFEERLKEIFNESFNTLSLTQKQKEFEEYTIKDILELSDEEFIEYEKCQPDYISSLPGDLRSSDPQVLQSRLDEIDKRLAENEEMYQSRQDYLDEMYAEQDNLIAQRDEAVANLTDYQEKEAQFRKDYEEVHLEAIGVANDEYEGFDEGYKEFIQFSPNEYNVTGLVDEERLKTVFEDVGFARYFLKQQGLLTSEDANYIKEIADDIDVIAGSFDTNYNDETDNWMMMGQGLADDLRAFADKYDVNNHPLGDTILELNDIASKGLPEKWENDIDLANFQIERNQSFIDSTNKLMQIDEKQNNDYIDNREKTQARLDYVNSRSEKSVEEIKK